MELYLHYHMSPRYYVTTDIELLLCHRGRLQVNSRKPTGTPKEKRKQRSATPSSFQEHIQDLE
jgi:hypothetical protein